MELPFKYIVLYMMKMLNERNMPLILDYNSLVNFFIELINNCNFIQEDKKEIIEKFDYELSDLYTKYYQYFDNMEDKIIFDSDYISDIEKLMTEEMSEYDFELINNIDFIIESDSFLLSILGIKVRKELYEYLVDIERNIENSYDELSDLDNYAGLGEVDTSNLINRIKKLIINKKVMFLNTSNLLSKIERKDLCTYASNIVDETTDLDDINLLYEDENFSRGDIIYNVFLKSIFTYSESYIANLRECLIINENGISDDLKNSYIKFYLTFLNLLEREINKTNNLLSIEFVRVKYRLMYTLDSIFDTALFINNKYTIDNTFEEEYDSMEEAVRYFINELLMYDDEKYRNMAYDTDNVMLYLDNKLKALFIETYYKLTNDKKIIEEIRDNELFEVNSISSSFLKDIVDNPKTKIKDK